MKRIIKADPRMYTVVTLIPPVRRESEEMRAIAASVNSRSTWEEWIDANRRYMALAQSGRGKRTPSFWIAPDVTESKAA